MHHDLWSMHLSQHTMSLIRAAQEDNQLKRLLRRSLPDEEQLHLL